MYRSMFAVALTLVIGGCAAGSGAPGNLPRGAGSGVFTTAEPQAVAACIAQVLGSAVQPVGDRLVITSVQYPAVKYSVGTNRGGVYTTQVAEMGNTVETDEARKVGFCASANVAK